MTYSVIIESTFAGKKVGELAELLTSLNFFPGVYHSRVLAFLFSQKRPLNVKEISEEMGIPNSKIYPVLKELQAEGVVYLENSRPKRYAISSVHTFDRYLEDKLDSEIRRKNQVIGRVQSLVDRMWEPELPPLDEVAYIFKGRDLERQIVRMCRIAKSKIFALVDKGFSDMEPALLHGIEEASRGVTLEISLPSEFEDIRSVITSFERYRLKETLWTGNTYIVIDNKVMLNISHPYNVGILTNDPLLVEHVCNCWNDLRCCA